MKRIILSLVTLLLVGCGAVGDPIRPTANFGVSIGADGVRPSASLGAQSGPVSINVGL